MRKRLGEGTKMICESNPLCANRAETPIPWSIGTGKGFPFEPLILLAVTHIILLKHLSLHSEETILHLGHEKKPTAPCNGFLKIRLWAWNWCSAKYNLFSAPLKHCLTFHSFTTRTWTICSYTKHSLEEIFKLRFGYISSTIHHSVWAWHIQHIRSLGKKNQHVSIHLPLCTHATICTGSKGAKIPTQCRQAFSQYNHFIPVTDLQTRNRDPPNPRLGVS